MFSSPRSFFMIPFLLLFVACEKDDPSTDDNNDGVQSSGEQKEAGASADAFLQEEPYPELVIHILYMDGYKPTGRAADSLNAFLRRYLNKPQGISIEYENVLSPGKSSYGIDDIDPIIEDERINDYSSSPIRAYLLIVDGKYEGNSGSTETLGIAYAAHRMALFGESVHEFSDGLSEPDRWKMEASVMAHEFGHILGLVANGTPMVKDHQDSGHGKHCNDEDCLMYYSMETSDIVGKIFGADMPRLDANCQKDLEANGGK
ncbi:MAG: membrane metalloprotease [Flavobacteriales bacterium]